MPPSARNLADRITEWFHALRQRSRVVDIGAGIVDRDRDAAGTLLGSALALRLFSFFVPFVLFAVGLAGVLGSQLGVGSPSASAGVSGSIAEQVDGAFSQTGATPWIAVLFGLFGMATAGRSLTRSLTLSSALAWKLGAKQRGSVRIIGVVVGIFVGITLAAAIVNRIRLASGVAIGSVSFLAVAIAYLALCSVLFLALPRGTTDPSAALPGAGLVALVLAGLQLVTQLYLPQQIESASTMYGSIGVGLTFLGWFLLLGRTIAFAFAVNAVVYEQVGSISGFLFGLPLLRALPRRFPAVARFFALDDERTKGV